jgi:hypothetical protein
MLVQCIGTTKDTKTAKGSRYEATPCERPIGAATNRANPQEVNHESDESHESEDQRNQTKRGDLSVVHTVRGGRRTRVPNLSRFVRFVGFVVPAVLFFLVLWEW